MAKHTTKEAFYERVKNLAGVNETSVKQSQIRNLGSLIDYKRASDGIAYGIIKENHHYYIKKAGTKQDPNVSDFAYIGGMSNITDFQFKSLAEADKQRNMIFHNISEAKTLKPNKSKSKMILTEGAKDEIDQAASKVPELDAATTAKKSAPEGGAEMAAGIDAMPAGPDGTTTDPTTTDPTATDPTATDPTATDSTEELPADNTEEKPEGDDEELSDMQKKVSDISEEIKTSNLDSGELAWLLDRFIRGFVPAEGEEGADSKMAKIDDSKRHELADMILDVVPPEDVEKLGDSVPQEKPGEADLGPSGLPEAQCAECGSIAEYMQSRGVDSAEALMECGEEEVTNMVSGYANAHNDGQNDGDIDNVAMIIKIINPEMLNSLKGDYGHEDYANKLEPIVNGMNECSQEEGVVKINELFGSFGSMLKGAANKVGGDIKQGVKNAGQAIGNKATQVGQAIGNKATQAGQAVGQYATGVKQAAHSAAVPGEVKKLEDVAANLGKQIQALNSRLTKAGQQPIDVKNILKAVTQQVTGKGAGVAGLNPAPVREDVVDSAGVEVMPVGQAIEEIKVPEKKGKALSTSAPVKIMKEEEVAEKKGKPLSTTAPVKIMKEEDEPEGEEIETDDIDIEDGAGEEKPFEKSGDKPLSGFAPAAQSLGVSTIKPDGAGVEIVVEPDKTVTLSMNEAKKKLIKQIAEGVNDYLGEISTGAARKAQYTAQDVNVPNDSIGNTKSWAQGKKFQAYVNPELVNYLKSQGVIDVQGKGSQGVMIVVPSTDGTQKVVIMINNNGYKFINDANAQSIKPEMLSKLPTIIKRVQADLKGEKSKFNPAITQNTPEPALNEGEIKLRKYIRERLEVKAGLKKESLNESKKSPTLKKLDAVIDNQFKLYEGVVSKKKVK